MNGSRSRCPCGAVTPALEGSPKIYMTPNWNRIKRSDVPEKRVQEQSLEKSCLFFQLVGDKSSKSTRAPRDLGPSALIHTCVSLVRRLSMRPLIKPAGTHSRMIEMIKMRTGGDRRAVGREVGSHCWMASGICSRSMGMILERSWRFWMNRIFLLNLSLWSNLRC